MFTNIRFPRAEKKSFPVFITFSCLIYLLIVIIVYTSVRFRFITASGFIIVILSSALFGLRKGLFTVLIVFCTGGLSFWIISILKTEKIVMDNFIIIGILFNVILAVVIGSFKEIINKLHREIETRKEAEKELSDYKNNLEEIIEQRNEELDKAYRHLHQAEKMEALGQLTGGIVHDFNNMLSGIIGYADLLKLKYRGNDERIKQYINSIFDTSITAASLISELLAFSRKADIKKDIVDIHELINTLIMMLKHSFSKKIIIVKELQAKEFYVLGDSAQLQNVLLNMAINARDSMPDGGDLIIRTASVAINDDNDFNIEGESVSGKYIMISVSDTGCGIDDSVMEHIFEPFFTTKEKNKGTGMGLASSYGTVKKHNGFIDVHSTVGEGTTFTIYLPLSDVSEEKQEKKQTVLNKRAANILLIDDEEIIRQVGRELLMGMGFNVETCIDGSEGVEYYKHNFKNIDLVILDIMMPKMDGLSCFRNLKKINNDVSVVISSGYSVNELSRTLMNEGAKGFLQKPFASKRMLKIINDVLLDK